MTSSELIPATVIKKIDKLGQACSDYFETHVSIDIHGAPNKLIVIITMEDQHE
jgi:hypothetical protein